MCFPSQSALWNRKQSSCVSYLLFHQVKKTSQPTNKKPGKCQLILVAQIKKRCCIFLLNSTLLTSLTEMVYLIDQQSALQRVQELKTRMGLRDISFRSTVVSWKPCFRISQFGNQSRDLFCKNVLFLKQKRKKYWLVWWAPHYPSLLHRKTMPRNSSGLHMWVGRCFTLESTWGFVRLAQTALFITLVNQVHVYLNSIPGTSGNLLKN